MARRLLGDFGRTLPFDDFACALAGVVASTLLPQPDIPPPSDRGRQRGSLWGFRDLVSGGWAVPPQAEPFAGAWRNHVATYSAISPPSRYGLALEVDLQQHAPADFDLPWLADTLAQADGVSAVHFVTQAATPPAEWLWPAGLAVHDGPEGARFREALAQIEWPDFVEFVDLASATLPLELLVFPGSLRSSLRAALAMGPLPRVHTVLVLGGTGGTPQPLQLTESLRVTCRADAVGVVAIPEPRWTEWSNAAFREFAHDLDLDVALTQACKELELATPLMTASADVMARAHIANWTQAVGERMVRSVPALELSQGAEPPVSPVPPPPAAPPGVDLEEIVTPPEMGWELLRGLPSFRWEAETNEASTVARMARDVRSVAPQPTERHAQAHLLDIEGLGPAPYPEGVPMEHGPLQAQHAYGMDVWIGPPEGGALIAPTPFPEPPIPPGQTEVTLRVVFMAPVLGDEPQLGELHLPREGASEPCRFTFTVPDGVEAFDARITFLHENRIVQTVRFWASVGETGSAEITFAVESVTRRDLDAIAGRRRFGAALLVNDFGGKPSLSFFADERARFVDTDTIDKYCEQIQTQMEQVTNRPSQYGKPTTKKTQGLFRVLAQLGSLLRNALTEMPYIGDILADPSQPLQIIAAKPERVLPLEFCYDPPAPHQDAGLCKQWQVALAQGACQAECPADRRTVVCPRGFWGLSRVIERHAYRAADAAKLMWHDFAIQAEPTNSRARLDVLTGSLCAASDIAKKYQAGPVSAAFEAIAKATGATANEVDTWDTWLGKVNASPQLLVLLAHTDFDPSGMIRTLHIGAGAGPPNIRLLTDIDGTYVGGGQTVGPLVLLFGCETASELAAFQSFVTQFRLAGAAIVIGTLTSVLGRHVAPMAASLVEKLKENAEGPGATLGDLMVRLRRELLAEGHPMVLTLTAFGDADWRL